MGGIGDLMKSERGIVTLVYLLGLLALMLVPGVDRWKVELWGVAAGGAASLYTAFKSLKPNDTPKAAPEPAKPDPNGEILS